MIKYKKIKRPASKTQFLDVKYNEDIEFPELMIIDSDGAKIGLMKKFDALELAFSKGKDLVLISGNTDPKVAKIIEVSKYKYEKAKKSKKSVNKPLELKEWWFSPKISERDILLRLDLVKNYLEKGGSAKLTVKFAPKVLPEQMSSTMEIILRLIEEFSKIITPVNKEGKNLSVTIKNKK